MEQLAGLARMLVKKSAGQLREFRARRAVRHGKTRSDAVPCLQH